MPRPGIIRGLAGPPKDTEPAGSTATMRTEGRCSRNHRAQPIRVPVVPAPTNRTSSFGNCRSIAGAVWR
ncbi:hypothetical protein Gobs01_02366 [Geodermatophilus obscurus DSM 43160]